MQHPFLLRQVSGLRRCRGQPPCPLGLPTVHRTVGLTRRAPRNLSNTSPNALRNKQDWSHWDVAILCKSVLLAPGTPSRRSKIRFPLFFATSHFGRQSQPYVQNARTECRPRHSGDSAIAESVPSSNELCKY